MNSISPWAVSAQQLFDEERHILLFEKKYKGFTLQVCHESTNLWLLVSFAEKGRIAFRLAYSVSADLMVTNKAERNNQVTLVLKAAIGKYHVTLELPEDAQSVFHYTTS